MGYCGNKYYVTLGIMSHWVLRHIGYYVTLGILALGIMALGNMTLGIMTCNHRCYIAVFWMNYQQIINSM